MHGYSNISLQSALEGAFHSIFEIISGKRPHPLIAQWNKEVKKCGIISPSQIHNWHASYHLSILSGDSSLIAPLLEDLLQRLSCRQGNPSIRVKGAIDARVQGPAFMLFQLVILREYLHRSPSDDDEIFRLVASAATGTQDPDDSNSDASSQSENGDPSPVPVAGAAQDSSIYRIVRQLTTPEQALAARLGWSNTLRWTDEEESVAPLEPEKRMVKVDAHFGLSAEEPVVFVSSSEGHPAYAWPVTKALGLIGGPPYVVGGESSSGSEEMAKDKPVGRVLPRMRRQLE